MAAESSGDRHLRDALYDIIFKADTPAGKWFDLLLIVSIVASVFVVMADLLPRRNRIV